MLHGSDEVYVLGELRLAHFEVLLHLAHHHLRITLDEEALGSGCGNLPECENKDLVLRHVVRAGELEAGCVAQLVT